MTEAGSHTPPEGVQQAAARGLEWREEHGRGGTEVGVARARDLSNGRAVSDETIQRMVSFFARHAGNADAEGWNDGEEGFPSAGRIAWELWGGDAGRSWAERVADSLEEAEPPPREPEPPPDGADTETVAEGEAPKLAPLGYSGCEWLLEGPLDATGARWGVVIIREGWSTNGRFYPREVLERAIPVFEGAQVAIYSDGNHLTPQERMRSPGGAGYYGNVVGATVGVHGDHDAEGYFVLRAVFECDDLATREKLLAQWRRDRSRMPGLSIDGIGETVPHVAGGRRGRLVTSIDAAHETTIVLNPAAGGAFETLAAADQDSPEQRLRDNTRGATPMNERLRKFLEARNKKAPEDAMTLCEAVIQEMGDHKLLAFAKALLDAGDTENASKALEMALDSEDMASVDGGYDEEPMPMGEAAKVLEALGKELAEARAAREEIQKERCSILLDKRLAESKLPPAACEVVRERFAGVVFQEADLAKEIERTRKIAGLNGGGEANGSQPVPRAQVIRESRDKLRMAMDLMFDAELPHREELSESDREAYRALGRPRIKQVYQLWADDPDLSFRVGPNAVGGTLQEATSSDFSNSLGVSMEKAMVRYYAEEENPFGPVVSVNPDVDNFKTQTRILWGGFGDLPTVSESDSADTYSSLGFPHETTDTYSISTRGGIVTITRVMVFNDDMQTLRQIPLRLARAARHSEKLFMGGLLIGDVARTGTINTDTVFDGSTLYNANHFNTGTTALGLTAFENARRDLRKQRSFGVSTTAGSGQLNNTTDPVTATVVDTTGMFAGQYIQVEAEIMSIDTVNSGTSLTLSRGQLGTTAANHSGTPRLFQLLENIPIGTIYAVVPHELEATLNKILYSEHVPGSATNDLNFINAEVKRGRIAPIVVDAQYLGGDTNNWYMAVGSRDVVCLEMAYLQNRQTPEIITLDRDETSELMFTRDNIRYKVRHEYGGTQVDYRGLWGGIVA